MRINRDRSHVKRHGSVVPPRASPSKHLGRCTHKRFWINARRCDTGSVARRHLVTLDVEGRPATFATAGEKPWKEAVRRAVTESGCVAVSGRFAVELEFRLGEARRVSEVWDLDNLIKPTLDAMEACLVCGHGRAHLSRPMTRSTRSGR